MTVRDKRARRAGPTVLTSAHQPYEDFPPQRQDARTLSTLKFCCRAARSRGTCLISPPETPAAARLDRSFSARSVHPVSTLPRVAALQRTSPPSTTLLSFYHTSCTCTLFSFLPCLLLPRNTPLPRFCRLRLPSTFALSPSTHCAPRRFEQPEFLVPQPGAAREARDDRSRQHDTS